jgi:hypothetical protein
MLRPGKWKSRVHTRYRVYADRVGFLPIKGELIESGGIVWRVKARLFAARQTPGKGRWIECELERTSHPIFGPDYTDYEIHPHTPE